MRCESSGDTRRRYRYLPCGYQAQQDDHGDHVSNHTESYYRYIVCYHLAVSQHPPVPSNVACCAGSDRHDKKMLELYGATACVNFPYSGLVDSSTMRVHRLRTASGREISLVPDKAKVMVARHFSARCSSARWSIVLMGVFIRVVVVEAEFWMISGLLLWYRRSCEGFRWTDWPVNHILRPTDCGLQQ